MRKKPAPPKAPDFSGKAVRVSPFVQWYHTATALADARAAGWDFQHPREYCDLAAAHFLLRWAVRRGFHQRINGASLVEVAELRCVVAIGELREAAGYMPAWQKLKNVTAGRKRGAVGAIKRAVRVLLRDRPELLALRAEARNEQAWLALAARPPEGYALRDGDGLGRRVETTDGARVMLWHRFRNIVAEVLRESK